MSDNELIAEFIGWKSDMIWGKVYWLSNTMDEFPQMQHRKGCEPEYLGFDKSWDWLMPVVEKIYNMNPRAFKYSLEIGPLSPLAELHIFDSIVVIYKAVVDFIKWYNQQPKP